MKIKDGVKVFIKNKKLGKHLFALRDDNPTILNPNMYGLLGGGIEDGEKPIEALKRELREESNINVYDIEELGTNAVDYVIKNEFGEHIMTSNLFVFLAQTDTMLGEAKLYEGQKLEYFTIEEALNLKDLIPVIKEIIGKYIHNLTKKT